MAQADGGPEAKKARTEKFYGDEELSDVILRVGDTDMHVHKQFLACKSSYFKRLFQSKGSKKKFVIDEDPRLFGHLMDAVYNYANSYSYSPCKGYNLASLGDLHGDMYKKSCRSLEKWWDYFKYAMSLSESYGLADDVKVLVEYTFLSMSCRKVDCLDCTLRSLMAFHYGFPKAEKYIKLAPKYVAFCLERMGSDAFNISTSALAEMLSPNGAARETKAPAASDTTSGGPRGPITLEFGASSLSDVTIVIGNYEFRVNKNCLANRSSYFQSMFFSEFKEKDEDRVKIEADGEAFKLIMELLYNNEFEDSKFLECRPGETLQSAWERISEFWKKMPGIMTALEFFGFPHKMVEHCLIFHFCRNDRCVECGNKKIFALMYNLDTVKERVTSTPETAASCLKNFAECFPKKLSFAPKDLAVLMESAEKKTPARRTR